MHSLNVTRLILEQLEQLVYKLPKYTMANDYYSLRVHIRQIDENYLYTISIWLMLLISKLGTPAIGAGNTAFFYFTVSARIHQLTAICHQFLA